MMNTQKVVSVNANKIYKQGNNGKSYKIIKAKEWSKPEPMTIQARIVLVAWLNSKGEISEYSTNQQTFQSKKYDEQGKLNLIPYDENLEPCFLYGHYEFWLNLKAAEEDFNKRNA